MDDERWMRVERDLDRVLAGQEDIAELVAKARKNQAGSRWRTRPTASRLKSR